MRAPKLAVLVVPFVAGVVAAACTSSGNLPTVDAGLVIIDGSVVPAGGYACVFQQRATYACPDETLAPTPWEPECVDNDSCAGRVNGTQTVAGCTVSVEYAEAQVIGSSCATWRAGGGSLPALDSGTVPACAPGTAAFTPVWHPPRIVAGACTKDLIDSYRQCVDDSAITLDPPSCSVWTGNLASANQTCLSCLISNEPDKTYGPIVELPSQQLINLPGCLAVAEGKTDGSGCGGALAAYEQCARAACLPSCPTGTADELSAEAACETATQTGACKAFVAPAQCAGSIEAGDAGTAAEKACFGATNDEEFEAVALALCGG
jgi:hypothetical protein